MLHVIYSCFRILLTIPYFLFLPKWGKMVCSVWRKPLRLETKYLPQRWRWSTTKNGHGREELPAEIFHHQYDYLSTNSRIGSLPITVLDSLKNNEQCVVSNVVHIWYQSSNFSPFCQKKNIEAVQDWDNSGLNWKLLLAIPLAQTQNWVNWRGGGMLIPPK